MQNFSESGASGGPRNKHRAVEGVFPGVLETGKDGPWKNRLAFIKAHGFHGTSVGRTDFQDLEKVTFHRRLHEDKGLRFDRRCPREGPSGRYYTLTPG